MTVSLNSHMALRLSKRAQERNCSLDELLESLLNTVDPPPAESPKVQFENIFEQATVGMAIINLNYKVERANPCLRKILGYSTEEFREISFREITHPQDLERVTEAYRQLVTGVIDVVETERRFICKDGSLKWARSTLSLLRGSDEQSEYILSVLEDIDELKSAKENLQTNERQLHTMLETLPVAVIITAVDDDRTLYANTQATSQLGVHRLEDLIGVKGPRIHLDQPERDRIEQQIDADGIVTNHTLTYDRPDHSLGYRLVSMCRIRYNGVDAVLSGFLDITELKQAEAAVRENEQNLRSILDALPQAVTITSLSNRNLYTNAAAAQQLSGDPPEKLIGQKAWSFYADEQDRDKIKNTLLETGTITDYEVQVILPDGSLGWRIFSVSTIDFSGESGFLSTFVDITERKRIEAAVQASERKLLEIFDTLPIAVLIVEPISGIVLYGNSRGAALIVNDPTQSVIGLKEPEYQIDAKERQRIVDLLRLEKDVLEYEVVIKRPDGLTGIYSASGHTIEFEGQEAVVAAYLDITESKRREADLRTQAQQLHAVMEAIPIPVVITSFENKILYANSAASEQINGATPESVIGQPAGNVYVDQRDRETVIQKLRDEGSISNYETHVWNADGSQGWRLASARRIRYSGEDALVGGFIDITERKRIEADLKASEERLRHMLETLPIGITITRFEDGELLYANARALSTPTAENPLTQTNVPLKNVLTGEQSVLLGEMLLKDGFVTNYEMSFNPPTGNLAYYLLSMSLTTFAGEKAVIGGFVDITERKRIQQELQQSEARYSGIINTALDAIITADDQERIIVFNQAAELMFGCSAEEAIGCTISRFIPERVREDHSRLIEQYGEAGETLHGNHAARELNALRMSGEEFPIEAAISQVTVGEKKFYTVVVRDITERKLSEMLTIQNEKMRVALEKEKELVDLKERFISTVSHEFRTPLTMIVTSSELLERYSDRMTPERIHAAFQNIRKQADELVTLMNDVLIYNKVNAGRVEFHPHEVPFAAFIDSIMEQLRPLYTGIHQIVVENAHNVQTLWADEDLLKRIFVNLMSNAIKYSPQGGEIRISVVEQKSGLVIRISDQGIGIPAQDQVHLFKPFHRATNTGDISGTGLGLSIVREFIEIHQGKISVESHVGKGTTFIIMLPHR